MAEHPFERQAARLFGQAPDLTGEAVFVENIDARLAGYARVRGFVLSLAGAAGVVIALRAAAGSDLGQRLTAWSLSLGHQTSVLGHDAGGLSLQAWLLVAICVCAGGILAGGVLQRN